MNPLRTRSMHSPIPSTAVISMNAPSVPRGRGTLRWGLVYFFTPNVKQIITISGSIAAYVILGWQTEVK